MCVLREMHNEGDFLRNRISRLSGPVRFGKQVLLPLLIAAAILARGGWAVAALPPPSFMPGFPLVAGPQIIFMWSPVIGAEKYRVYLDGKSVAEVAAFQHILPLPKEGKHSYYVVAVDKEGKESPAGKAFEYEVRQLKSPKNLAVLVREKKIALRWDAVEGALVYDVFRGEALEGPFGLIGSTQDSSFLDPNVKQGVKYYYRVASKDTTGSSSSQTEPVIGVVELEVATVDKKIKILKTKPTWELKGVSNASDILYLSDDSLIVVSPFSPIGPHLEIIENLGGAGGEKRSIIPLPEEHKEDRFGGLGRSGNGTIWVTGNLPTQEGGGGTIYRVDPASKSVIEILNVNPLPKTQVPYSFMDVCEAPNGDLYVTEQANSTVMVIRKGKIISRFGEKGRDQGQFAIPTGIEIVDDKILVTDAVAAGISFFGLDGKFIRRVGSLGGRDPGTFSRLAGIAVDLKKNWLFAADRATSQIQLFDLEGNFLAMLANEQGTGSLPTTAVAMDVRNETLLVTWQSASMVQEYKLLGPLVERQ